MSRANSIAATVLALAACQPLPVPPIVDYTHPAAATGHPRCDAVLDAQNHAIEDRGWRLDCTPDFPPRGTSDGGQTWFAITGWSDDERRTVWLWPDEVSTDTDLRYLAWHETGHIEWAARALVGDKAAEERWADGWAWCREPIVEASYAERPADCTPYL